MKNLEKWSVCIFGLKCLFGLQMTESMRLDHANVYISFRMDTNAECSLHGSEH
jgi:hypothetical protein